VNPRAVLDEMEKRESLTLSGQEVGGGGGGGVAIAVLRNADLLFALSIIFVAVFKARC
jgi:hypothetical protein